MVEITDTLTSLLAWLPGSGNLGNLGIIRSGLFYSAVGSEPYVGCILEETKSTKSLPMTRRFVLLVERRRENKENPTTGRQMPVSPFANDLITRGASFISWPDNRKKDIILTLINPDPVPLSYDTLPGIGKEFINPDHDKTLDMLSSVLRTQPLTRPDPSLFRGLDFFSKNHENHVIWSLAEVSNTVERYPDDRTGKMIITFRATYISESDSSLRIYGSLTFTPEKDFRLLESYIEARKDSKDKYDSCNSDETASLLSENPPCFIHIVGNSNRKEDLAQFIESILSAVGKNLK